MRGNTSVGDSVLHGGSGSVAEFLGSSFSLYHFLSDYVWEFVTTHANLAALGLAVILLFRYLKSPWRCVPPGPRGLPVIGNAFEVRNKAWLFEQDCTQRYKDMVYLNALGQPILVIHGVKAAAELLDRRANIYSSRPRLIMAHEILTGGLLPSFLPYGEAWRRNRRAAHEGLTKSAVRDYHTILLKEGALLASALLADPGALEKHFQRTAASATLSILYDYPTLESENDNTLKDIRTLIDRMSLAAAPGAYLVELMPWMLHIPETFAKWKYDGRRHFEQHNTMFETLLNGVRSEMSKGSERPSFSATLIKTSDRNQLSNQEMAWLVGSLYAAGAETTANTLYWWTLAMIAHPELQKRAQAELDAAVGRSRVPTFSDAPNLPYVQAIVKEVLRWRPALPLGLPHTTTEDDWYNGMFIPKETLVLTNLWHCNHESSSYGDDAKNFRPERHLDANGEAIPGPAEMHEDGHSTFGFGRRACAGKYLASDSLFIYTATALWAATFERIGGQEAPIDTETYVDTGMVLYPLPFRCNITPRFPEVPSILSAEKELY
ncbi:cytochrome P450 [Lactarius indigo]|nr:cytochrome P450 [Lactarius indigo]